MSFKISSEYSLQQATVTKEFIITFIIIQLLMFLYKFSVWDVDNNFLFKCSCVNFRKLSLVIPLYILFLGRFSYFVFHLEHICFSRVIFFIIFVSFSCSFHCHEIFYLYLFIIDWVTFKSFFEIFISSLLFDTNEINAAIVLFNYHFLPFGNTFTLWFNMFSFVTYFISISPWGYSYQFSDGHYPFWIYIAGVSYYFQWYLLSLEFPFDVSFFFFFFSWN